MNKQAVSTLILFILAVFLFLSSCKTTQSTTTVQQDSTSLKEKIVYKDTIIHVPGDTIRLEIPCDKDTVYIQKGKSSSALVHVKDGKVTVQANCDEKDLIITKLSTQIERIHKENREKLTKTEVQVPYIPKFFKYSTYAFWGLLILFGLFKVLKYKKIL